MKSNGPNIKSTEINNMSILNESKLRQKVWLNELRALSVYLEVIAEIALKIIKEKPTPPKTNKHENKQTNKQTHQQKKPKPKKPTTARVEA